MSLPDAAAAAVDPAAEQPRRLLGMRHGIAMCAGMVIGSGIFKSTPMVAASISSPSGLLLVWLVGGALSSVAALRTIGGVALLQTALAGLTRGAFDTLVDFVSPVYWFSCCSAAPRLLRRRFPAPPRPFRVPLYPWLPRLFCATSAYVLYATLAFVKVGALVGLAVLALGTPLLPWFGGSRRVASG